MLSRKNVFGAMALALAMTVPALAQHAEPASKPAHHQAEPAKVGATAPAFEAMDADGKPIKLSDYKGKVVVLEWFNPGCPVVQMHYKADTMNKTIAKFEGKNVVWLRVNSGAEGNEGAGADASKQAAGEWHIKTPIIIDSEGTIGHAYGAKTTPHCFVIDTTGTLVYAGAIDNGSPRKAGDINYVEKAVFQTLAGETVANAETKPYGCGVKYKN